MTNKEQYLKLKDEKIKAFANVEKIENRLLFSSISIDKIFQDSDFKKAFEEYVNKDNEYSHFTRYFMGNPKLDPEAEYDEDKVNFIEDDLRDIQLGR